MNALSAPRSPKGTRQFYWTHLAFGITPLLAVLAAVRGSSGWWLIAAGASAFSLSGSP